MFVFFWFSIVFIFSSLDFGHRYNKIHVILCSHSIFTFKKKQHAKSSIYHLSMSMVDIDSRLILLNVTFAPERCTKTVSDLLFNHFLFVYSTNIENHTNCMHPFIICRLTLFRRKICLNEILMFFICAFRVSVNCL